MKFLSYSTSKGKERLALLVNERIYDLAENGEKMAFSLPSTMCEFLKGEQAMMDKARKIEANILEGNSTEPLPRKEITLLAPIPHPTSCRDAYAFRQHVATARRNRGVDMIPEFDQFPVFYFTNHNAIIGEGDLILEQDHLKRLDFELEAAIVIGKRGKNISAEKADSFIAGYTIMNDFSARQLQMEEMKLNLGPAKGKDFATAIGPWMVTPDEMQKFCEKTSKGNKYNLRMTARHNGKLVSDGNLKDMDWTFGEIIERVSYGVEVFPGDVIGSGTVGTGCYLELNGTWTLEAKEKGKTFEPIWLKDGDEIELEIQALGKLTNRIVKKGNYSILEKKKNI